MDGSTSLRVLLAAFTNATISMVIYVSNNIIKVLQAYSFYTITVYTEVRMRIKAIIVPYVFSAQHFKNTTVTLVAYVGLRVNAFKDLLYSK